MESLTFEEMGDLITEANIYVSPKGEAVLIMSREKALWLINAGLTELRRCGPMKNGKLIPPPLEEA